LLVISNQTEALSKHYKDYTFLILGRVNLCGTPERDRSRSWGNETMAPTPFDLASIRPVHIPYISLSLIISITFSGFHVH
jgi:hypothetical protein